MIRRGLAIGVLGLAASACIAQDDSKLHLTLENYSIGQQGTGGLDQRLCWLQLTADASSNFSFTNTYLLMPSKSLLDETFVRFNGGSTIVRAGRVRSAFGFNDWSDYYYDAIIGLPMVRFMPLQPYMGLLRFDTGFDVRSVAGPFEYQVGLIDPANSSFQWTPKHLTYGVARLQTHVGSLILGASALSKLGKFGDDDTKAFGLDFRWTAERVQLRGELIRSSSDSGSTNGFYIDAFYRPPKFYRTQLGARVQSLDFFTGAISQQYTLGLRQILTPSLAATLNYGLGSGGAASSLRGWSFEVSSAVHF